MEHGFPDNVWLGATVVNQEEADRDIPKLLQIPAKVRFLSVEPMLGAIDLSWIPVGPQPIPGEGVYFRNHYCDWVIVGGESGPKARPMHPDWARSLRDQCEAAGVPFFFKQHGEYTASLPGHIHRQPDLWLCTDGRISDEVEAMKGGSWMSMHRLGTKATGRMLDGSEHSEFPV